MPQDNDDEVIRLTDSAPTPPEREAVNTPAQHLLNPEDFANIAPNPALADLLNGREMEWSNDIAWGDQLDRNHNFQPDSLDDLIEQGDRELSDARSDLTDWARSGGREGNPLSGRDWGRLVMGVASDAIRSEIPSDNSDPLNCPPVGAGGPDRNSNCR